MNSIEIESTKKYWLGLKMVPPLNSRLYVLAEMAGGPKRLWEAERKDLVELGLTENTAAKVIATRDLLDIDREFEKLTSSGIAITLDDEPQYPELLRHARGHPKAVFVKGELATYKHAVAIVGSRRATSSGKVFAQELARDMSASGVAVVSGAARGIDTAAHWGAIEAGGVTFGVLGCGLDTVYPPENGRLFDEICNRGALISEYPPGMPPLPHHFPARNRIVAGMCQGTVVVEAGIKSGALITADFALDYGREVFAVPGAHRSQTSKGANKLIKQGAYLIESAADVCEVLGIERRSTQQHVNLTPVERDFLDLLGWEAKRFDEIARKADGGISSISTLLVSLEISGFIKKDLDGCYIRVR